LAFQAISRIGFADIDAGIEWDLDSLGRYICLQASLDRQSKSGGWKT
jgi:hypothetical protein